MNRNDKDNRIDNSIMTVVQEILHCTSSLETFPTTTPTHNQYTIVFIVMGNHPKRYNTHVAWHKNYDFLSNFNFSLSN